MNSLCKAEAQFGSVQRCNHSTDTDRWLCFVFTTNEIMSFYECFVQGEKTQKAMCSLPNTCLSLSSFHSKCRYSDFGVWLPSDKSEDGSIAQELSNMCC